MDLKKSFDRVNHHILMGLLAKWVTGKRILKLIRAVSYSGCAGGDSSVRRRRGPPNAFTLTPVV
jgi:RNA-directed DNA polymerase